MKDIEFLNEVNDRVVLSVDEPIYQSTERFIHTMSEQLELSPQQIKDALSEARRAWARQHAQERSLRERAGAARDGAGPLGRGVARQASREIPS